MYGIKVIQNHLNSLYKYTGNIGIDRGDAFSATGEVTGYR